MATPRSGCLYNCHGRVDINFLGGRGKFQALSMSLHHAVLKSNTVALQRLLVVPRIDLTCAHGRVDTMKVLLDKGRADINASGLGDPPTCQTVERAQLEAVRLLVQQGGRLQINRKTKMAHDTALCIAARDGNSEIARALLRHDQIDLNLENQWPQAPLALAAQGGGAPARRGRATSGPEIVAVQCNQGAGPCIQRLCSEDDPEQD